MQLTVRNWQKDDESHFSCIATNSLGKADRRIQSYSKSVTACIRFVYIDLLTKMILPFAAFVDQGHRSEPDVNRVNPTPEYEFIGE